MSTIHWSWLCDEPNASWMEGRATLRAELPATMSRRLRHRTARLHHRRAWTTGSTATSVVVNAASLLLARAARWHRFEPTQTDAGLPPRTSGPAHLSSPVAWWGGSVSCAARWSTCSRSAASWASTTVSRSSEGPGSAGAGGEGGGDGWAGLVREKLGQLPGRPP